MIVNPADYTPEIVNCIDELRSRMESALVEYKLNDLLVFEDSGVVFILANPALGQEPIYDDFGRCIGFIPMKNITLIYYDGPPGAGPLDYDYRLRIRLPRLRILRPELCLKIENGQPSECTLPRLEEVVASEWIAAVKGVYVKEIGRGELDL